MFHETSTPIIITDGGWMHIRQILAYHNGYPEIRGEGRTRAEALVHLTNQLAGILDSTPDLGRREAVEQAIAEVRATGRRVARGQVAAISTSGPRAATSGSRA